MTEHITLTEVAEAINLDRSNARKYILKRGFSFSRIRTNESRGQLTLALTQEDAEAVKELRRSEGFASDRGPKVIVQNGKGWFYVVQIIPDLDANRVKLGFTNGLEGRLQAYRTASPSAMALKSWPCKQSWERAAMDSVTRIDCKQIGPELFKCDDLKELIRRGDRFFSAMPIP